MGAGPEAIAWRNRLARRVGKLGLEDEQAAGTEPSEGGEGVCLAGDQEDLVAGLVEHVESTS
jgi:hypothetical protein